MERNRPFFFLGAAWEIIRFFVLFLFLVLERGADMNFMTNLLLLWFGASQLGMSAGFLMTGLFPERYGVSVRILALGKFLSLLPGAGVCFIQASVLFFVQMEDGVSLPARILLPFVIVLTDLIFFLFLVSYSKKSSAPSSRDENSRPFSTGDVSATEEE